MMIMMTTTVMITITACEQNIKGNSFFSLSVHSLVKFSLFSFIIFIDNIAIIIGMIMTSSYHFADWTDCPVNRAEAWLHLCR